MSQRLLRVVRERSAFGVRYERAGDGWQMVSAAPMLHWLADFATAEHRRALEARGFAAAWLPAAHRGVERIVACGEPGAPRAALELAQELKLAHGGISPRGGNAKDKSVARRFGLGVSEHPGFADCDQTNIADAEGSLWFTPAEDAGDTRRQFFMETAVRLGRPWLVVVPGGGVLQAVDAIVRFQGDHALRSLHVAGSSDQETGRFVRAVLRLALSC